MEGLGETIYSSPLPNRHQYNDPTQPYMVMVSPEHTPYASPARQSYLINNTSIRSNVQLQPFQPQSSKNAFIRFGRYPDTPTQFKTATALYEDMITNNNHASSPGIIHTDYMRMAGIDPSFETSPFKYNQNTTTFTFPESFNPRIAPHMPHKEKVTNWIDTIPLYHVSDEIWSINCYPAVADDTFEEADFSTSPSPDELFELQARRVTYLCIQLYLQDPSEEIITPELQEKAKNVLKESADATKYSPGSSESGGTDLDKKLYGEIFEDKGENHKLSGVESTPRKRKTRKC